MDLNEAKDILENNGYILDEGIFDSIKNKFFKKKEDTTEVKPASKKLYDDQIESREEWEEGAHQNESVNKAIKLLESAGYIVEDTDDWDEADMPIGTLKQRADRVNKHSSFRDLDHKTTDAANFNIKNLFYGVEKELKKVYKKVELEASDYDDENKSQLVRYYYTFNKKTYNLEVLYHDEDGVINVQLFADDWYGHERDDFSVTTIEDAIKQIMKFAHYNTI